jgi:hypothetical protein
VIILIDEIDNKNVLLIEPDFPIPKKSRNHKDFLPIGLLKIASYLKKERNCDVQLIRLGSEFKNFDNIFDFYPDIIFVTSLFTYWADDVQRAVSFSKEKFTDAYIVVGGIYASLLPKHCKKHTGCDEVFEGVWKEAEEYDPDYSLVDVDYQIIHTSRGCERRCPYCGVYIIEPKCAYDRSIKQKIVKRKLVFYDNNFLANENIESILKELIELKKERKILSCESQSGFDGRILHEKPHLGVLLKKAGFINPKIAWDGPFSQKKLIKNQIDVLINSGYKPKEISIFMLYNYNISFEEMENKRIQCWKWNVQITDCRFRPLKKYFKDNYNPYTKKPQSDDDYYIHHNWTDKLIRMFRSNIRKQNICVRQDVHYYSADIERKRISKVKASKYKNMGFEDAKNFISDAWNPAVTHNDI